MQAIKATVILVGLVAVVVTVVIRSCCCSTNSGGCGSSSRCSGKSCSDGGSSSFRRRGDRSTFEVEYDLTAVIKLGCMYLAVLHTQLLAVSNRYRSRAAMRGT